MRCSTSTTPESLAAIVADYKASVRPRRRRAKRRFRDMPDLKTAIHHAAMAIREDGKMESHQWRVGRVALRRFEQALQRRRARITSVGSFDDLFDLLWSVRVRRVGRLAVYDTAVRIGWHLGLEPEAVYVHAGAAKGARELDLPTAGGLVERRDLPPSLRRLASDEVEDCLCIYKSRFGRCLARSAPRGCTARKNGPCA
jgi:hypothetical protein